MSIRETVDAIQNFVKSARPGSAEKMAGRAEEYAQACEQVNERLRRCLEALRRGMRTDAIQMADAEPNLLDTVALLDFPELPTWKEVCSAAVLPDAPEILMEAAAELNEAYAVELPLQSLLSKHRRLALSLAPVSERLKVMREIAALDPASIFWDDDIKLFENARIKEIANEAKVAVNAGSHAAVEKLRDELNVSQWRTELPANLLSTVENHASRLNDANSVTQLKALTSRLNEAYAAMSRADCANLLNQWQGIADLVVDKVPAEMQAQADEVGTWLTEEAAKDADEARFNEACQTLQSALDNNRPTPALERAYQTLIAFHHDIPDELNVRYHACLAGRAAAIRHKRRLIYAGLAAGVMLVFGVLGFYTYQMVASRELAEANKVLDDANDAVNKGKVEKGVGIHEMLAREHPRTLKSPQVGRKLAELDAAIASERQRQTEFSQGMKAIEEAGFDKFDQAQFDQVKTICKTDVESAQLSKFNTDLAEHRHRQQQEIDQKFNADAAALSAEIDRQLPPGEASANPEEYDQKLQAVSAKLQQLRGLTGVSEGLKKAQLLSMDAVLGRRRQELGAQQAQVTAWADIRKNTENAEKHAAALRRFVNAYPEDPHCRAFRAEIEQLSAQQAMEEWSDRVKGFSQDLLPLSYANAQTRVARVKEYMEGHPSSPLAERINAYQTYLLAGLDAAGDQGPWKTKLRRIMEIPIVSSLNCVETVEGLRYYMKPTAPPVEVAGDVQAPTEEVFEAVTGADLNRPLKIHIKGTRLKSTTPTKSPQAAFSEASLNKLKSLDFAGWDTFGLDLADALRSAKTMHPVLRGILLQRVLEFYHPTLGWCAQDQPAKKTAEELDATGVGDMEWLDPTHPPDPTLVDKIESKFASLRSGELRSQISACRDKLVKDIQVVISGEGVLLRSGDKVHLYTSMTPTAGQVGLALADNHQLREVATVVNGQWSVKQDQARLLTDGALVFFVAPAK